MAKLKAEKGIIATEEEIQLHKQGTTIDPETGEELVLMNQDFVQKSMQEIDKVKQAEVLKQIKGKILAMVEEMDDTLEEIPEMEEPKPKPQWDVESILSTHTNTDNHPGLIKEVVRAPRAKDIIRPHIPEPQ